MKKILFICTGNTCRSPMAEGIFNKIAKDRELNFRAESCGICTASGLPASENSRIACDEIGVDLKHFKSREISDVDFTDYELIAVMTEAHAEALISFDVPLEKICILAESRGGISDPYGGDLGRYVICRDEIVFALDELLERLMAVKLRELNILDAKAVHRVAKKCFENPWSEKTIEDLAENANVSLIGAFRAEKLLGFASLEWVLDEGALTEIAVLEEHRLEGIGKRLMEGLLKVSEEKELSFVTLEVRESNIPAISLYKKFGFEEVGVRKNYYKEPLENAVLMTKYLK